MPPSSNSTTSRDPRRTIPLCDHRHASHEATRVELKAHIRLEKPKAIPPPSRCDMLLLLQWPGGIRYETIISGSCDFRADQLARFAALKVGDKAPDFTFRA